MYLVLGKQVLQAEVIALVWVCVESILGRVELSFHLDALFGCQRRSGTRSPPALSTSTAAAITRQRMVGSFEIRWDQVSVGCPDAFQASSPPANAW